MQRMNSFISSLHSNPRTVQSACPLNQHASLASAKARPLWISRTRIFVRCHRTPVISLVPVALQHTQTACPGRNNSSRCSLASYKAFLKSNRRTSCPCSSTPHSASTAGLLEQPSPTSSSAADTDEQQHSSNASSQTTAAGAAAAAAAAALEAAAAATAAALEAAVATGTSSVSSSTSPSTAAGSISSSDNAGQQPPTNFLHTAADAAAAVAAASSSTDGPTAEAAAAAPTTAGTVSTDSSSLPGIMSFEEEDVENLSSMYDVINRASKLKSLEQRQWGQLQQMQAEAVTQQQQQLMQQPNIAPVPASSSSSGGGSISGSLSSADIAALSELQIATEQKLAELAHVVEELNLGEEATQQLTVVLHKLEQLEQDLSAVVSSASASDTAITSAAVVITPAPEVVTAAQEAQAAALAAAATVKAAAEAATLFSATAAAGVLPGAAAAAQPTASTSSAAAVAHTVEMEALAASAAIGAAAANTPAFDSLTVPTQPAAAAAAAPTAADSTKLWPLFVLGLSYVHQATSGFALPALLPMISPELHLSDFQGAFLTSGYSYLYALALVPVGLLADKVDRPKLLAVGLALWSALSIVSSKAGSFAELMVVRTGFAIAQAAQNPVSFSLIPDLFPANKSTALAGYNCAIYLGRALSFASVLAAHRVGAANSGTIRGLGVGTMADAAAGTAADEGVALSMVPLDALDLQRMSIIYTTGDMAAVTPLYNYNFHVIAYEAASTAGGGWRELLTWIGVPGFAIALLMLLTVREPRHGSKQQQGIGSSSSSSSSSMGGSITDPMSWREGASNLSAQLFNWATGHGWHSSTSKSGSSSGTEAEAAAAPDLAGPACAVELDGINTNNNTAASAAAAADTGTAVASSSGGGSSSSFALMSTNPISTLLRMKSFQATTIAAALNDVGSYALIAWHSTFYERVFGLDSGVYAPMLAVILPVGGILGGVGGGLIADWLSVVGGRYWLTAGASLLAAPFVAQSLLADDPGGSFTALLVGFALSEAWRAPGAIMIRSVAPQELGSTASALYLCIRNLIGGFGPVAVAKLAEAVGLQQAMLLAPACYVLSGLIFLIAEKEIEQQAQLQRQQQTALQE